MFWFFGHKASGILAPEPGIKTSPPPLEGKVFFLKFLVVLGLCWCILAFSGSGARAYSLSSRGARASQHGGFFCRGHGL